MPRIAMAAKARRALDLKLSPIRPVEQFAVPAAGWIKAIRQSLAMSQADLAHRMRVSQATVAQMERSEASDTIQLATLRRAADAMECDLVYALVPRTNLEDTVRQQAALHLSGHLRSVAQTMSLEDQDSTPEAELVEDETARLIDSGRLWK
jgi:predicted DNA-binding mobile mystery protein A